MKPNLFLRLVALLLVPCLVAQAATPVVRNAQCVPRFALRATHYEPYAFASQALAAELLSRQRPGNLTASGLENSAARQNVAVITSERASEFFTIVRKEHRRPLHEWLMRWGTNLFDEDLNRWFELFPDPRVSGWPRMKDYGRMMRQVAADAWRSKFMGPVLGLVMIAGVWTGPLGIVLALIALGVSPGAFFIAGVHWIGGHYILPGSVQDFDTIAQAVEWQEKLGFRPIMCLAGEQAADPKEAQQKADDYVTLAQKAKERWPDSRLQRQVAIKLSNFDKDFRDHQEEVMKLVLPIAKACRDAGLYLVIDGEYYADRDAQIAIFHGLQDALPGWDGLGLMVQTYFLDSLDVIDGLIRHARVHGRKPGIRIAKGAYYFEERDLGSPVLQGQKTVDRAYRKAVAKVLEASADVYPMIATMNPREQDWAYSVAEHFGLSKDAWGSQMLYGMVSPLAERMVKRGQNVSQYLLFGDVITTMKYLKRRRPEITRGISWRMFDRTETPEELAYIDPEEGERLSVSALYFEPIFESVWAAWEKLSGFGVLDFPSLQVQIAKRTNINAAREANLQRFISRYLAAYGEDAAVLKKVHKEIFEVALGLVTTCLQGKVSPEGTKKIVKLAVEDKYAQFREKSPRVRIIRQDLTPETERRERQIPVLDDLAIRALVPSFPFPVDIVVNQHTASVIEDEGESGSVSQAASLLGERVADEYHQSKMKNDIVDITVSNPLAAERARIPLFFFRFSVSRHPVTSNQASTVYIHDLFLNDPDAQVNERWFSAMEECFRAHGRPNIFFIEQRGKDIQRFLLERHYDTQLNGMVLRQPPRDIPAAAPERCRTAGLFARLWQKAILPRLAALRRRRIYQEANRRVRAGQSVTLPYRGKQLNIPAQLDPKEPDIVTLQSLELVEALETFSLPADGRTLVLGCGRTGVLVLAAALQGGKVDAIDKDPEAVRRTQEIIEQYVHLGWLRPGQVRVFQADRIEEEYLTILMNPGEPSQRAEDPILTIPVEDLQTLLIQIAGHLLEGGQALLRINADQPLWTGLFERAGLRHETLCSRLHLASPQSLEQGITSIVRLTPAKARTPRERARKEAA